MKALIVGGGIGGLTAALAFHHFGWDAEVLEQAPAITDIGAGIQISPNGMKVFRALGLENEICQAGFRPDALEMRFGRSGRQIFRVPLREAAPQRWGAPYVHVHRADLVGVLSGALERRLPGALRTGCTVLGHDDGGRQVSVRLAQGECAAGDLVVGADGIHSVIRTQMLGPEAPRFTGCIAWRAIVPASELGTLAPPSTACIWVGPGRHAVTYLLRRGTLANFVGVVERDGWRSESWIEQGSREEALADFAGWHPVIGNLIAKAETHYRWALFDRAPLPRWHSGRAVLIGDACHPALPFMAQGAVMAIEDAYVLAMLCAQQPGGLAAALQAFHARRIGRTSRVQLGSRRNGATFHRSGRVAQIAAYGPMRVAGKFLPQAVLARQDWLYGHDVTRHAY